MPAGRYRSRTYRRVHVKTPGGRTVLRYRKRKPSAARCSCGALLKGVPRERPYKFKKIPQSSRKPTRPFGGNLCSKCMRALIIARARK